MEHTVTPNHHAHHHPFAGPVGLVAAVSMLFGRDDDARIAARLTHVEAGDAVLDIGCGPGVASRYAAKLGATVTGVDPASVMLRVARLMPGSSRVRWVDGSAEALPVTDDAVTVVWALATVHHWHDIDRALDEIGRVLRAGGRLVAIEHQATPDARGLASHGWSRAQADAFADACRAHGFSDVAVAEHPGGHRPALSVAATLS
jgi:ubiquinone/menaquinone biosynthesis C-methylase UbiE